jgi:hypothetical protein
MKEFTDYLEPYLSLRERVKVEEALGSSSYYYSPTYGFGDSKLHKDFDQAREELNRAMRSISMGMGSFGFLF